MNKHAFERSVLNGIPLHEAVGFLHRIKTAGWGDPPDETGLLEGQFSAPVEQVIAQLTEVITAKFQKMLAYHVYSQSMRGIAQHGVAEVFIEHAEQERAAAEAYLKRAAVLGGGPVHLQEVEPPPASADPVGILMLMARAEQEGIAAQRMLKEMVGEDNPLRFQIEAFMVEDQHHLDELWQMLPQDVQHTPVLEGGADPAAVGDPAGMEAPPELPGEAEAAPGAPPEAPLDAAAEEEEPVPEEEPAPPPPPAAAKPPAPKPKAEAKPKPEAKEEPSPEQKEASARFRMGLYKLGFAATGMPEPGAGTDPGAAPMPDQQNAVMPQPSMAAPGPQPPMATPPGQGGQYAPVNYLEAEETARRAQAANEAGFYRDKAMQSDATVQSMGAQVQEIQAQLDQLSAQAAESQNQIMAANQEAQTANDQMLNQATLAARMRMGMQQLRAQMMEIASQDPEQLAAAAGGPTPMDVGQQAQQAGMGAAPADPGLNGEAMTVDPATGQPGADPGAPGAAPAAEGAPGSPPGGAGQPASGGSSSSPEEPAKGEDEKKDKGETTVSIKKASVMSLSEARRRIKTAGTLGQELVGKLPYMAAGALAGGASSVHQGSKTQSLREQVDALKGQQDGGFAKTLELGKTQMALAQAEDAKKHPVRSAITGGLAGAGLGAAVGAAVPWGIEGGKRLAKNISTVRSL